MITLFRRIRQKLIDSGSITKYLLYAVGEILLVVIGILIALQVNNWNEERKDRSRADQYLTSLRTDLQEDLIMLQAGFDIAYDDSVELMSQLQRLNENINQADTVKNILINEMDYYIRAPRPFNRKTYTTLLSTGDIGLLSDDVAQRLVQLIKEQDVRTGLVEAISEVHRPTIVTFYQKYPLGELPMSQSLNPIIYEDIDEIQMLREFNVIATMKLLNSERIMARQRSLKPLTEDLIDRIDKAIADRQW